MANNVATNINYIQTIIANKMGVNESEINIKKPFFSIGVSSLISEEILAELMLNYDNLSSTLLFEYPSVTKLSTYLSKKSVKAGSPLAELISQISIQKTTPASNIETVTEGVKKDKTSVSQPRQYKDIAIIGISGRFPKANNPLELWENLKNNINSVTEVPKKRWDATSLYSTDSSDRTAIFGKWGGFIEDIEYFDPMFFQIPYREAELMDPQQKLFLQCGWELMENAGYANTDERTTDNIGVYVGVTWNEFSMVARDASLIEQKYKGPGSLYWGIPNRLSYTLDLKGPSVSIDTACSSSLVAIHDACQAIRNGDCDMAIAGGVNLNLHPAKYQFLSQNHFLSSEGLCRSFGEGGDGYVPGEGVAAVLLKSLVQAEADGDYIYGVIKSTSTNHGGKVTGYTVPNPVAHKELIKTAIEKADINPEAISYIECHGTGTYLGDPIEVTGLSKAFETRTDKKGFCAIGSLKSNIGHLEAAAGVAGLIKILLSMQNETLPASLHSSVENKKLALTDTPFYIVKKNTPWISEDNKPLIAGLSSFGAGGSNAHLIVENYHASLPNNIGEPAAFILSAETSVQLASYAKRFYHFFSGLSEKSAHNYSLANIANSLLKGRKQFTYRLAIQGKNLEQVTKKLSLFIKDQEAKIEHLYLGKESPEMHFSGNKTTQTRQDKQLLNLEKWCQLWVQNKISTESYFEHFATNQPSYKVPLPNYPLLQERSWINEGYPLVPLMTEKLDVKTESQIIESADSQGLHPLVDHNISTVYQQKFEKTFNVSEFVLKDHLVNEVHVIPGVCHLEMARKCASEAISEQTIEIKDVWFSNVISVPKQRRVEIDLTVDGADLAYTIHDPLDETIFSRGKIGWLEAFQNESSGERSQYNIENMRKSLDAEWDIKEVYGKFIETGIIQKESFQVLKRIEFNKNLAIAKLELPDVLLSEFEQFSFHPALMDGIVQTAMMHVQYFVGKDIKILPFHFTKVKLAKKMQTHVYVVSEVLDHDKKQFNLTLTDMDGYPLVEVSNFILREMKSSTNQNKVLTGDVYQEYYAPVWLEKASVVAKTESEQCTLIFTSNRKMASQARGKVITVMSGKEYAFKTTKKGTEITLQVDNANHYIELAQTLKSQNLLPDTVIYNTLADFDGVDGELAIKEGGESLFLFSKAFLSSCKKLNIVAYANGRKKAVEPFAQALAGFFKTLSVEKPSFTGRVVLTDKAVTSLANLIAFTTNELATQKDVYDVKYLKEKRLYRTFEQVDRAAIDLSQNPIKKHGHYLITGGMGGIGLVFAEYMIAKFDAQVYLTGRSQLDNKKQALLDTLSAKSVSGEGQAYYLPCDVSQADQVNKLVAEIGGDLNGIIHSAGTIEDGFILRKEQAAFNRVIAPKINGTLNLDNASQTLGLDFFCLFSSVTSILGNLGQCDYGYANAFEDYFCAYRNQQVANGERQGKSIAINWPYWKNGGMQLTDKEEEILTRSFGFTPLENSAGILALENGLRSTLDQIAVLEGDQEKIQQVLGITQVTEVIAEKVKLSASDTDLVKVNAVNYLKELFAKELKIPQERIDTASSFERYGFDSIVMIDLINIMEKEFESLPKTLFFEYQTIDELADYFVVNHPARFNDREIETASVTQQESIRVGETEKPIITSKQLRFTSNVSSHHEAAPTAYQKVAAIKQECSDDDIAIIGVSGRYPEAANIDEFWQNIKQGRDSVVEVPETLWDWRLYFKAGKPEAGKSSGKWGGFLDNVDQFDPLYFNISPKEAETMDPQERLFLETATLAIQDAGYTANTLSSRHQKDTQQNPVGVFVGTMWGDYQLFGVQNQDNSTWTTPRSFYWAIANRISYFYNFSGPSITIDTACSSSLTAIHMACESLKRGEVDVAIAGGVNLTLHPNKYNLLSEMQFLSSDGRCRSFGEGGDGYVPGDGVGAVILKPLAKAQADGDNIYAVIKGTSINHGGKTSGFTVPNPNRQSHLIKDALSRAGVNPRHISYVEAHGTGTSLGDPIEMIGLNKAYNQNDAQYCAIGSVKSNIGHLEAAAGIAALTKVLLQLKHQQIAPSIHSEVLNPNINFSASPFVVQKELGTWDRPTFTEQDKLIEVPRMAGISSFGAGGSNAHIVVEEYVSAQDSSTSNEHPTPVAIVLSAMHETSLQQNIEKLTTFVNSNEKLNLRDLAYTLQVGREQFEQRFVVIVHSINELIEKLTAYMSGSKNVALLGSVGQQVSFSRLFSQDGDSKEMLNKWLESGAQDNLASVWVSGINVDWSKLYLKSKPQRLSLPGYTFDTKRYWAPLPSTNNAMSSIHPLVDQNLSTLTSQLFTKVFSVNDNLLSNHKINGMATLPGSALIEMAVQAALLSNKEQSSEKAFTVKDIFWAKGITVKESFKEESIATEIELVNFDKDCYLVEVGVIDSETTAQRDVCAQAKVSFAPVNLTNKVVNIEQLKSTMQLISPSVVDQAFADTGFEFGENYQVFNEVYRNQQQALVKISLAPRSHNDLYLLNPITLDAALRSSLFINDSSLTEQNVDELSIQLQVPKTIVELSVNQTITDELYVVATLISRTGLENNFNIDILSLTGEVIGHIKQLKTHVLAVKKLKNIEVIKFENITPNSAIELVSTTENYLKTLVSQVTKLASSDIDTHAALEKYGIDSVMVMALNEKLESVFGKLSQTLFYEYQDLAALTGYFVENHPDDITEKLTTYRIQNSTIESAASETTVSVTRALPLAKGLVDINQYRGKSTSMANQALVDGIAVIGVSGKYPQADNLDEFWLNLSQAKDCIQEIPTDRWNFKQYFEAKTISNGKSSSKWGGFINGIDEFDASLFNILPDQAKAMDPQERLFLQTVWATLEDAGYAPGYFSADQERDRKVGVFAGSMWNQYAHLGLENTLKGQPTMTYAWDAAIANRVSHFFDFHGPSMTLDTACSSSLLAIHHACESLKKGECRYAIAGGVNLTIHPYKYDTLTQMQMLSSDGRCRSFGDGGDGYVPGEGVGAVLLKPLAEAIKDGDNIYGVIKGSATNHNGKTNGFTVPNPVAQAEGIKLALTNAGLTAEDVNYFEAHGTGTSLGDPIEFNALDKVFKESDGQQSRQIALGSVKSNIGHLEGAAGVVALTKVLLQMKHKKIVASLHSTTTNKKVDFAQSPLYIPQQLQDWQTGENETRCAGIASLGAGGTNAYLIVEEYIGAVITEASDVATPLPIVLSARSLTSLQGNAQKISQYLSGNTATSLTDLAYTLQVGRVALEHRVVITVDSKQSLLDELAQLISAIENQQLAKLSTANIRYCFCEKSLDKGWKLDRTSGGTSLSELAEHWLKGINVDWSIAYKKQAQRISLPSYAFEQASYWPELITGESLVSKLSPLVDHNTSTFQWQSFSKTFTEQQTFIADHKIGKQCVIAGATILEMVLQSSSLAQLDKSKSRINCFKNIQFLKPAIVDGELDISVALFPQVAGNKTSGQRTDNLMQFEVVKSAALEENNEYDIESNIIAIGELAEFIDIAKIKGYSLAALKRSLVLSKLKQTDIYQYFSGLGLEYGHYFQVTNQLFSNETHALVELSLSKLNADINTMTLHPALLDGALRSVLIALADGKLVSQQLNKQQWTQLVIPSSIDNIVIYSSLPNRVYCHVQIVSIDADYQSYVVADLALLDEHGDICVEISGFKAVAADIHVAIEKAQSQASNKTYQEPVSDLENVDVQYDHILASKKLDAILKSAFNQATGIDVQAIKVDETFDVLGVDSITITKLNRILDKQFNGLSKTVFFECNSLAKVSEYLIDKHLSGVLAICDISATSINQPITYTEKTVSSAIENVDVDSVYVNYIRSPLATAKLINIANNHCLLMFSTSETLIPSSILATHYGCPVITVTLGKKFTQTSEYCYTLNASNKDDFSRLFEQLTEQQLTPVFMGIVDDERVIFEQNDTDLLLTLQQAESTTQQFLLNLVQYLSLQQSELLTKSKLNICYFYSAFGLNQQPHCDAIIGLANGMHDINSQLVLSPVRLHPGLFSNPTRFTKALTDMVNRVATKGDLIEYDLAALPYVFSANNVSEQLTKSTPLPIVEKGTYLITGGLGAIGLVMAEYLVKQAKEHKTFITVVLIGRSSLADINQTALTQLNSEYSELVYQQAELSNYQQLSDVLIQLRKKAPIYGVLHCAGISADTSMLSTNYNEFKMPMLAKCTGTVHLDLATMNDKLDFFVLSSSITTQIGDFGAGSYSYANSYQDSYASLRHFLAIKGARQGRTLSIGWPLWELAGVDKNEELVNDALAEYGLVKLSVDRGLAALEQCWASKLSQVSLYAGNKSTIIDKLDLVAKNNKSRGQDTKLTEVLTTEIKVKTNQASFHSNIVKVIKAARYTQNSHVKDNRLLAPVQTDDIAIVGLSGKYPSANSLDEFWQNLSQGHDSVTEIPASRWDYKDNYSSDRNESGKVYAKWGAFLDNVDQFDPQQFGIAPRNAKLMDPQERLFLQESLHCMEDAGYTRSSLAEHSVGVYVGVMWGHYQLFDVDEYKGKYARPGSSFSAIANQVSYYFDFHGPSLSLDTMCSSSLSAIHTASQSILAGECDYALAGGVNLSLHENKYQLLAQGQFLSSDGRCRAFGDDGDGYVPGEGVGVVLLKRLSQAVADNDHIYGVIKGSAINHGGRTNGFTVPNPTAQGQTIKKALDQANWHAESISYVEAHGTGTSLGDPIEIAGLEQAFNASEKQFCAIGSVKSNIGHLESASGIAGLTKVLLQMNKKQIVPSIHSETFNKNIKFEQTPFEVSCELQTWTRPTIVRDGITSVYPLRAGVSSFGAGGSNAHLLVEEYIYPTNSIVHQVQGKQYLFVLSAKNEKRLQMQVHALLTHLQKPEVALQADQQTNFLANIAYTLQVGRECEPQRMAIVASDYQELIEYLVNANEGRYQVPIYRGSLTTSAQNMEDILDNKQRNDLIDSFIRKQDYFGLASLWVSSINVPWLDYQTGLFSPIKPSRVSLPGSPLLTKRYWINEKKVENRSVKQSIHPLLDRNSSTLFSHQYETSLSGSEFYINTTVNQNKVLAVATYLELARAAAQYGVAEQGQITSMRNIKWVSPLLINIDKETVFSTSLHHQDNLISLQVKSNDVEQTIIHAEVEIELLASNVTDKVIRTLDIQALKKQATHDFDTNTLDSYYAAIGHVNEPAFRVTKHIYSTNFSALSELVLPDFLDNGSEEYLLHPSLLDGALRSCMAINSLESLFDLTFLSLDKISFYKAVNRSCFAYAQLIKDKESTAENLQSFDIQICDSKGDILVDITGFTVRQRSGLITQIKSNNKEHVNE